MATKSVVPSLPTPEEYDAVVDALALLINETVEPAAERVFGTINYEGEQAVTYAEIGALNMFTHWLRWHADDLNKLADKLAIASSNDLDGIRLEGKVAQVPSFNEYGSGNEVQSQLS